MLCKRCNTSITLSPACLHHDGIKLLFCGSDAGVLGVLCDPGWEVGLVAKATNPQNLQGKHANSS